MATLLIVDDDPSMRTFMRTCLLANNHMVYGAESGKQALTLDLQPDLVLLDHYMEGMTGLEVAVHLKKKQIPFLFVSSTTEWDIMVQAIAIGAMGFIRKPFQPEQLTITTEAALARANDLSRLRAARDYLSEALTSGRIPNIAVGLIMERFRLSHHDAKKLLANHSSAEHYTVQEAAERIINKVEKLNKINV